jgi:peptidoglycan/LPS O-acetylase OafA/YrhL
MQTKALATQPQNSSPSTSQERDSHPASRWYYLDWLRVLALLAVFLFHSTKIFSYGDFFIKNRQVDWGMELFDYIVGLWVMPLFFVLAAVAISFSLTSRNTRRFLAERCKRLLIPLLLGIFLLSPVPVYLERITHGQFSGSLWQFLTEGMFPEMAVSTVMCLCQNDLRL